MLKFCIRVDGSSKIGFGHLVRMVELGRLLRSMGDVTFISRDYPEAIEYLHRMSVRVEPLRTRRTDSREAISVANMVRASGQHVLVTDLMKIPSSYAAVLKTAGARMVGFDLTGESASSFDVCINALVGANSYVSKSKQLIGPQYVILRSPFVRRAGRRRKVRAVVESVLIVMGGSDPHDLSFKIASSVSGIVKKADVVIGPGYFHDPSRFRSLPYSCKVHSNISADSLSKLILAADAGFVNCGVSLYECASLGLPTISFAQTKFEEEDNVFRSFGITLYGGLGTTMNEAGIRRLLNGFVADRKLRGALSRSGLRLGLSDRELLSYFRNIRRQLGN